ncbi:helix-turn-helix domain-containing protein [Paenibacillus sp. HB172176]|uniref:helix-turn-helix domain-containing protein n=1 Tax=Paenibacillus sp. HB172176 TaxID=2493690 RepID=UPI00143BF431|nr:helix-turn-helix domain-containing protein [Paenibacillus sp. HB172176]
MRLVIVDDEKGIIDGLKAIIRRHLPAHEVVGVAYNGIDGCRIILETMPDVVLTDIRMPQSDGLDMIRELLEHGCKAKFIMLSGYAEYEYARKGMELGVRFYLNKPVEVEELIACMNKVEAEVETEHSQARQWNEFMLREMMENGYSPAQHEKHMLHTLRLPVKELHCACALLEFSHELEESQEEMIRIKCANGLKAFSSIHVYRYEGAQYAVLVLHEGSVDTEELVEHLKKLRSSLNREWELPLSIGVGQTYASLSGIAASFTEAKQALRYKMIKGANAVMAYQETTHLVGSSGIVSEEEMSRLDKCIESMDEKGAEALIGAIFQRLGEHGELHLAELQNQVLIILLSSMRRMSILQLQSNEDLSEQLLLLDGISRFQTLSQLEQWVKKVILGVIEQKRSRGAAKKTDVISEVKNYMEAYYDSKITLADLSAKFYLNPFYLSQLFKEKTGETYQSYLTAIRMNKARELLGETDLKVYEICRKVGYADTNHFSKVFEKMFGATPSEYRK